MPLITRCEKNEKRERSLALRDAIELLGGKWKICILQNLSLYGTMRFKDLQEEVAGISSKVLTKELQQLEQNFLVVRTINNTKPVTVSYSLTEHAYETRNVFNALLEFGAKHRAVVKSGGG
ncbi:helix-turn-helix transcriptional regulator [Pseudoflavitalea sp. G-6-1-2]|uniref:winged helix-turn-helix transcriptional regulator n=1 Tax=Pseudoflavitalea sp. G-6-1-2 TaxID=2728841 RepID=UPI00146A5BA7|nr:helix-turn-helix domain-containing protein [Pseudoflavitalea sp. G-6-1-2]NML21702.1 helix-turn-helix transcriptional regulator [Pseudoflavitalea sp. G-6-1-2]